MDYNKNQSVKINNEKISGIMVLLICAVIVRPYFISLVPWDVWVHYVFITQLTVIDIVKNIGHKSWLREVQFV